MSNKIMIATSNVSSGVDFFLRGAKKRRSMAIASIREINTDICVSLKAVSPAKA